LDISAFALAPRTIRKVVAVPFGLGKVLNMPRSMRVLVVDDHVDTVQSTALMLSLDGHAVEIATDGIRGIERAASSHPEMALLDLAMPNLDGFELARQIRRLPLQPPPYLVAVTGFARPDDKRRCAEAGFDLHLTKPVAPETFRELASLLDSSRRITERSRELAVQSYAIATSLIFLQLEMANLYLDSAATTRIDGYKERYVAHAKQAYERAASWLHSGVCTNDRIRAAVEALAALRQRLSL
jgi:CheY-like chemotaxis protein